MNKHIYALPVIIMGMIFMLNSPAGAVGLGAYLTFGGGDVDWTYTSSTYDESSESETGSSMGKFGLGFVLDTAVANDRVFNYRLNIGYTAFSIVHDDTDIPDINGYDYHLYNTFGFGIVRTEKVRFWIGPQIGFGFLSGQYDESYDTNSFFTVYFAAAAVAGVNLNLGRVFSLCIDGGYRVSAHAGGADIGSDSSYDSSYDESYDVSGSGKEAFCNVSFIFRINDSFSPVAETPSGSDDDLDLILD